MDEGVTARLNELSQKLADASFLVGGVLESETAPQIHEVDACHDAVAEVTALYGELLAATPPAERETLERTHGRRVTDLRRLASRLPQKSTGRSARPAAPSALGFPDYHLRVDPVLDKRRQSRDAETAAPERGPLPDRGHRVGGWVEAWCGPCGGLREHTIVAMVGGEPKQVICESCGARHGYRTTPARSRQRAAAPEHKGKAVRGQADALRREEARTALQKELADASEVRPFQPRQRYKAGEIIEHAQFGRGKIENVLKGSLLVRFRDGLKSVSNL